MAKGNKGKGGNNNNNNKKHDRMVKASLRKRKERLKHGDEKWRQGLKAFTAQLEPLGFIIKDVAGDGNCLFRSIADQLEDNPNNHKKYRQEICKYLLTNKDMFAPFVDDEEHDSYEEYVEEMQEDATWGGNIEIQAASLLYSVNIAIHQLNQPRWEIVNFFGGKQRTIQLSYHNDEHYASVRPINAPFFPPQPNSVGSQSSSASTSKTTTTSTAKTQSSTSTTNTSSTEDYSTISDEVFQIMDATGCTSVKLVKEALEDCNYNVDIAIDMVLALSSSIKTENEDNNNSNNNNKTTTTTTTTTTSSSTNKVSKNPYKGVKKQQQQEQQEQQDNKKEDTHLSNKERKKLHQQQNGTTNAKKQQHNLDRNSIVDDSLPENLGSLNI